MANEQQFDPRFDPAFQRGFGGTPEQPGAPGQIGSPEQAGASEQGWAASGTGSAPLGSGRRSAAPVVQQVAPPTPVRESPPAPASAVPPAARPDAVRADEPSIADDAEEDHRQWANPFLIALAVAAVALVGTGLWMFQAAREPFLGTNATSQADYAMLTLLLDLAPLLLALGAATAVGIVFFFAIDWQRRAQRRANRRRR